MKEIYGEFYLKRSGFTLDVKLAIPPCGVTALYGKSGSGKTTILRCIAGLERSVGCLNIQGEIWQDADHWIPPHKRSLGYVFQEASLFAHLTVLDNLRYGLKRMAGWKPKDLDQPIDLLDLSRLLTRKPAKLSGGERQRVALARALALRPRLLLMDEPLASLDFGLKQEILPYLERLHQLRQTPILYVTHEPREIFRLADQLVVVDQGRVVAQGPLSEILTSLDPPIRLGESAGTILTGVIGAKEPLFYLARLDFPGGSLWLADKDLTLGESVRVEVLAQDVSLSVEPPALSSIQNVLRGQIEAVKPDGHQGLVLVRVRMGGTLLLASITKKALLALSLGEGQTVWVQMPACSLLSR
jgi:molybdate transport system ATP-binding protein